ncbi:DUF5827 family protein [Haloferax namakaokahaiae]|uniref:DUF5827 family protein n=1 Tax=Haloferax namakaokahaiae TaxID=1748331 RepID=A0ABD5Z9U1_9EURY
MPKSKDEFETLYGYLLYEPTDILHPDYMYTVPEIARMLQGLDPTTDLAEDTEDHLIDWTIPWIISHEEDFVINDPRGDEPGYFGLHPDVIEDEETEE